MDGAVKYLQKCNYKWNLQLNIFFLSFHLYPNIPPISSDHLNIVLPSLKKIDIKPVQNSYSYFVRFIVEPLSVNDPGNIIFSLRNNLVCVRYYVAIRSLGKLRGYIRDMQTVTHRISHSCWLHDSSPPSTRDYPSISRCIIYPPP